MHNAVDFFCGASLHEICMCQTHTQSVCTCMCAFECTFQHAFVCAYIHIYITYIYIFICIYTNTYSNTRSVADKERYTTQLAVVREICDTFVRYPFCCVKTCDNFLFWRNPRHICAFLFKHLLSAKLAMLVLYRCLYLCL